MSKHLEREIQGLKRKILMLSSVVEESVSKALVSVKDLNQGIAEEVLNRDQDIDLKEVEVEEDCLKILALHQPVAIDLRYVVMVLKMNNDLERIGDLAVNIAERAIFLSKTPQVAVPFDFDRMSQLTREMLRRSINAFIQVDAKLAQEVCSSDDEVDQINRAMYDKVYDAIRKHPEQVEPLIHYLSISRHLERIADYATNLAEDVIYMIEGRIIRHQPEYWSSGKSS